MDAAADRPCREGIPSIADFDDARVYHLVSVVAYFDTAVIVPGKLTPPISGPPSDRSMRDRSTKVTSGFATGAETQTCKREAQKARRVQVRNMMPEVVILARGVERSLCRASSVVCRGRDVRPYECFGLPRAKRRWNANDVIQYNQTRSCRTKALRP